MTIKTYTWVKYLATFSSLLLLIDPLFCLLKVVATHFFIDSWSTLMMVTIPLFALGAIGIGTYVIWRCLLIKKSTYTYTKKDQFYLIMAFVMYLLAVLMSGFYLLVALMIQDQAKTLIYVLFGLSYFLVVIGMIGGSIFETLSRVQEQIKLYHDQEATINAAKKKQRQKLMKAEISEEEIQEAILKNRTNEAQQLLARTKKTAPVKKTQVDESVKTKKPVVKAIKSEYNPFLDEKLNQDLLNDPEFKTWLANEKKEPPTKKTKK